MNSILTDIVFNITDLFCRQNPYPAKQEHCSQLSVVEDAVEIDFPSDLSDDAVSIITQVLLFQVMLDVTAGNHISQVASFP